MGPLRSGPRGGTGPWGLYKTPDMGGSIRAQRGRARSALFHRVKIKRNDCVFLIHDLQFLPTSCRIQDYNATGQYQSGSGRVAACSNDYSTTNESLYNTMYSSLDLSASAAAMSDMLIARQYSGGGGHAPSSTPPLSYNSAAINEHLLQGT